MAYLVSEGLVLFQIDVEMLLVVLQVLWLNLGDILFDVWERIRHVLLAPASCVEQHVHDGLLFDQHLVRLI